MNPAPITISSPALLDAACKAVGDALETRLSWLTNAYGRAEKKERTRDGQRIQYPAVYCGGNEYLMLFPDGHLSNFCFFDVTDGYTAEWTPRRYWQVKATVGLIFWFDMRTVYASNHESKTAENVKDAVLTALGATLGPAVRFTVNRILDRSENIFRGYSISEIDNQFMMRPYGCFRLEGELVYQYHCA
jgi:hypothetical protein